MAGSSSFEDAEARVPGDRPRRPGQDVRRVAQAADVGPATAAHRVGSPATDAVVADVRARLVAGGVTVGQEARWLVDAATRGGRVDRPWLDRAVQRRVGGEPLQVVVGQTPFRHVTVACRSGVFVPRPETEVVAGAAIAAALGWPVAGRRVLDLCTGTGAIALSVAGEVPGAEVLAVDRDRPAVDLARHNVDRLVERPRPDPWRVGDHLAPHATVEVVAGDLFGPVPADWRGTVAVLVANPPYLPAHDRGTWSREVAEHDPDAALVGGTDGHEVVDAILRAAPDWLAPSGTVVVELDERRSDDATAAATAAGLADVHVVHDLAGRPRAVVATRPAT